MANPALKGKRPHQVRVAHVRGCFVYVWKYVNSTLQLFPEALFFVKYLLINVIVVFVP